MVDGGSDDSLSEDNEGKHSKRNITLTRRPSYRKILNDLRGAEIASGKVESDDSDSNLDSELSSHSLPTHYQTGKSILLF